MPLEGQGRLLDFGCGGGSFLIRMRRLGWNVTGLDFSSAVVDRLRATHGLTVHQGSLPHADLPDESFDVITMWESLEHVHQPLDVLRAAQRLLAKGGKILVSLHNIESVAFRWFGPAWFPLDLPRHLTHFSPSTLRLALHEAGFQPGRVRMLRSSSWLRKSADIAKAYPTLSGAWMRMLRSRLGSNLASWYCYLTRAADSMLVIGQKAA
ncbi:MAG: class I SAM-dependent methyltransferase [Gemmataceae bacterium]